MTYVQIAGLLLLIFGVVCYAAGVWMIVTYRYPHIDDVLAQLDREEKNSK